MNAEKGTKGFKSRSLEERFWEKVDKRGPDECWLWKAGRDRNGYGHIGVGKGRSTRAHRVSWELANGSEIPVGLLACHTCDNPPCVNPAHIFIGTMADNLQDASAKGRVDPKGYGYWTHCKRGHEFSPENTIVRSNGWRDCRSCRIIRNSKRGSAKQARP